MCRKVTCPNDGKPTWMGCGAHIEMCLAGIPEEARCTCPHVPSKTIPGYYEVAKMETKESSAPVQIAMDGEVDEAAVEGVEPARAP